VLRIPCAIGNAHGPEDGTRLVKNSLYRLPGPDIDLTGISGANLAARDADGRKVFIMIFNSDALFGTGSDEIGSTDSLDNTIKVINTQCPGGVLQVRGHTDGTGAASSNQALSQRRAERVRTYLAGHGTKAASTSSVGLGSSQPLVEEKNPDGSASVPGRAFNRRVELVVRY
jgi:outer membrane protein OmpA-like peptidoglycan-associated protein